MGPLSEVQSSVDQITSEPSLIAYMSCILSALNQFQLGKHLFCQLLAVFAAVMSYTEFLLQQIKLHNKGHLVTGHTGSRGKCV